MVLPLAGFNNESSMSVVMAHIHVRFIINELTEEEIAALKDDHTIVSKMILLPDDYKLFHYREGDTIEVQTDHGNRLWCRITNLEVVSAEDRVVLIFTLVKEDDHKY
jgi:hypothetical protein